MLKCSDSDVLGRDFVGVHQPITLGLPWWMSAQPVRLRAAAQPPTGQEEMVTVLARFVVYALAAIATVSVSRAADDASYPAKPIHIVVGFAAGGAPDGLARVIADRLTQSWNQSVIVENRAGAAGNIAMAAVAKSAPDGTMLALVPVGNAAINPSLFPDLPCDLKQFAPITQIANVENVLVVGAKSPVKSLAELIALGRTKDANLTYATPGAGSIAHLAAELFARTAGFRMTHIGY